MNRILKRPMFRIGGSTGTGITSGLTRSNYSEGTPSPRDYANVELGLGNERISDFLKSNNNITSNSNDLESRENIRNKILRDQSIFDEFFSRSQSPIAAGTIPGFLIGTGLNLTSATPKGRGFRGVLATAAESAKDPFRSFQKSVASRNIADDKIRQALIAGAISSEDARQLSKEKFQREIALKGSDSVRTLTEPEIKALNLPKNTIAQIDNEGKINIVSKPSAKEIEKRADYANTIGLLNKIEENYFAAGKPVGPIYNLDPDRLKGAIQQFTGGKQGELLADLEADIKKTTVFLTKAISGAQVSDKEREFIMQLIPQISDTEVQFERKLKSLRSYLADAAKNFGGDVEALMKAGVSAKNYIPTEDKKELEDMSDDELNAYKEELLKQQGMLGGS